MALNLFTNYVNVAFAVPVEGGGIKASGIGREGGSEGIEEYLETKYIAFE